MSSLSSNLAIKDDRRRSQRVLLRMPVAVIARGPDKKMVSQIGQTLVVNAHGALLSVDFTVSVNQTIILHNPETGEEQTCRVIRCDAAPEGKNVLGIEFVKPAPNFWRVAFPPEDWAPHSPELSGDSF